MLYTGLMLLFLVRHAMTSVTGKKLTGRLPGIVLSKEGLRQAESLGGRIAGLPLAAIYTSPLERCHQTAEILAAPHRRKLRVLEDLSEIDYGGWQGRSLKTLYRTKAWRELRASPGDFRFPEGETIREAQTRGMAVIESLKKKHLGEMVLCCSHADLIRLIVAGYLGLGLDLYTRISILPASITAIWLGDHGPSLLRLGDDGGLEAVASRLAAGDGKAKKR
jgi:probable phosphomutase (TIGR03848 family)